MHAAEVDAEARRVVQAVLAGDEQLRAHVQAIVDLQRGTVVGYEALARFPDGLRPDVAFDVAHVLGDRPRLQALALEAALAHRATLPPNTFLSVNVDPADLGEQVLLSVLLAHAPLDRIVVELTEHSAVDLVATAELLADLRRAGATIAVDDVGAGYAGMQALLALRPDLVKLDRSLVADVDTDPVRQQMVRMLGDLAGRMDAWVLAEGIETVEELECVSALGVPLGQGWVFGHPRAPWGEVGIDLQQRIRLACLARPDGARVASLVEDVPTRPVDPRADPPVDDLVVEVDDLDRPVRLCMPPSWGAAHEAPMVVQSTERVDALGARLAVRTGRPPVAVVVTRPSGRVIGVVRTHRVLAALLPDEQLADQAEPSGW